MTTDNTFNEYTLLADIIDKWGEHGAHADLMRWMIEEIKKLTMQRDSWYCDAVGLDYEEFVENVKKTHGKYP